MSLYVFTDYACPFCYIGYMVCKTLAQDPGCVFRPVYMEIHPDMPEQGADSIYLFTEKSRERMNVQLEALGQSYGIKPQIGKHLSSSKKAITMRAFLATHYPEKIESYDDHLYALYHMKLKDIGDEAVLDSVRCTLKISESLQMILSDPEANRRREADKRQAGMNFIHTTPTFKIGEKCFKGIMEADSLKHLLNVYLNG